MSDHAPQIIASIPLDDSQRDALLIDMHGRVSKIEAHIELLPDHEQRLRKLEKRFWGVPGGIFVALLAALGIHFN